MAELRQYQDGAISYYCYSERGLMSYYFFRRMASSNGRCLFDSISKYNSQVDWIVDSEIGVFSEFDLGNRGFGKPDGAVSFKAKGVPYFIFIETKLNESYQKSTDNKAYNSSIIGQIELKYRFSFALKNQIDSSIIQESDEFRRQYKQDNYEHRNARHLYLRNGVIEIAEIIRHCDLKNIFYLIVTKDDVSPLKQPTTIMPLFFLNTNLARNMLWIPEKELM